MVCSPTFWSTALDRLTEFTTQRIHLLFRFPTFPSKVMCSKLVGLARLIIALVLALACSPELIDGF